MTKRVAARVRAHCARCNTIQEIHDRAPCPTCGAPPRDRITDAQMDSLRRVQSGRDDLPPGRRNWLRDRGLIASPPRAPSENARLTKRGSQLTERGTAAIAADDADPACRPRTNVPPPGWSPESDRREELAELSSIVLASKTR